MSYNYIYSIRMHTCLIPLVENLGIQYLKFSDDYIFIDAPMLSIVGDEKVYIVLQSLFAYELPFVISYYFKEIDYYYRFNRKTKKEPVFAYFFCDYGLSKKDKKNIELFKLIGLI